MMEMDSFLVAGLDVNGDVQCGCWELTKDMMDDIVATMSEGQRIYLTEPKRSN